MGVAGVLFSGLFFAHFGEKVDAHVLHFVREFGLILFVYSIGVEVGPRFVNSFRNDGLKLNMLALSVVLLGFITAFAIHMIGGVDPAVVTGIMSGAVTTPAWRCSAGAYRKW